MPELNYAYVKNGDAVDQVTRILDAGQTNSTSGPDAFLADFLTNGSFGRVRVLSRHRRIAKTTIGNISAEVTRDGQSGLGKVLRRAVIFTTLLLKLLAERPNRILCGSTGSRLWAAYLSSVILQVPLVHSRHNRVAGESDGPAHRLAAQIDRLVLKRTHAVVCHGPYLVDEMKGEGIPVDRIFEFDVKFTDYEAARGAYYRQQKVAPGCDFKNRRYLLFVGRLETDKGIVDLLQAAEKLLRSNETLELLFAGDGNGRPALEHAIAQLGLQDQVHLLGRVPHSELVPLFVNAICLVAPTRPGFPEGRCMSVMEALVMECPAIVPNFGPFPYLIEHTRNGLLFEPGSVSDLSTQLENLINDQQLELKLKAGAKETGEEIRTPPRTFNQAVTLAYN